MSTLTSIRDDPATLVVRQFADAGIRLGPAGSDADIIMTPAAYSRFLEGELGIGESFQDGLCREGRMTIDEFTVKRFLGRLTEPSQRTDADEQSIKNSLKVARKHYDLGNPYFLTILDPELLLYSCAWFFKGAKNLQEAQLHKAHGTGSKMRLKPGDTVLDIGCGSGGLLRYFHQMWDTRGTGTTLSREQAILARERNKGRPNKFFELDYRNLEGQFDHIVSVGMFEHVGPGHYLEFFRKLDELLKPGGDILLHSIYGGGTNAWIKANIFPGGELPTKQQVEEAIKGIFAPVDWHWFGRDYDPTLMAWNRNMHHGRDFLEAEGYGGRIFRTQNYFQKYSAGGFRARAFKVAQVHLFRVGETPADYVPMR